MNDAKSKGTGAADSVETAAVRSNRRLEGLFEADPPESARPSALRTAVSDLLRYRWFVARTVVVATVGAVIVALLIPNQYTSTAVLLPSGKGGSLGSLTRGLSGQLADLGIGGMMQGADPSESSELFPDILKSRTVGEAVLAGFYTQGSNPDETPFDLYRYFDSDYAFESLYDLARIRQEPKTGIITIAVTTPYPEFSRQIASAFLSELETFNRERRTTQGTEKAGFLAERLSEVKSELEAAEAQLKIFRSRNMNFAESSDPEILAELSRLERNARIKAEVYALLTQQHELARLEAADQMPIVQVLDAPAVPTRKSGPHRSVIVLVTAFLSFMGACMVSVGLRPLRQAFPDSTWLARRGEAASTWGIGRILRLRRRAESPESETGD